MHDFSEDERAFHIHPNRRACRQSRQTPKRHSLPFSSGDCGLQIRLGGQIDDSGGGADPWAECGLESHDSLIVPTRRVQEENFRDSLPP
jgi:hypothetical protein